MSARPWFKFYSADWRSDTALRTCSAAARGVWLEMITLMDEATPRGHLALNGRPMTPKQLALLSAVPEDEVLVALAELEAAGVFSRTTSGTIISRKMVRETKVSDQQRGRAETRWAGDENIGLFGSGTQSGNAETDAHMPEARVQKPETQIPEARVSRARKPEIPIPESFPDQQDLAKGEEMIAQANVVLDVGRQAVRFRGHAETTDRRCRDWRAAWRTWLDKSIDSAPRLISPASTEPEDWRQRAWMQEWIEHPNWWSQQPQRGPAPDQPGCKVTAAIMAEFGYTPVRRAEG